MKIERIKLRQKVKLSTLKTGQKFWRNGNEYRKVEVPFLDNRQCSLLRLTSNGDWDSNIVVFEWFTEVEIESEISPPKTAIGNLKRGQIVEVENDVFAIITIVHPDDAAAVILNGNDAGCLSSWPNSYLVTVHDDIKIVIGVGK